MANRPGKRELLVDPFRSVDTYHVPREITINVPTAQLEATNGPVDSEDVCRATSMGQDILVFIARMKPIPAPLAIPLSRLFRAHGISGSRCKSSSTDIR